MSNNFNSMSNSLLNLINNNLNYRDINNQIPILPVFQIFHKFLQVYKIMKQKIFSILDQENLMIYIIIAYTILN